MRLNTMILPNGYTVDFNAIPRTPARVAMKAPTPKKNSRRHRQGNDVGPS